MKKHLSSFVCTLVIGILIMAQVPVLNAWDPKNFKKPSKEELKAKLSDIQFSVTQHEDTERPFKNPYWDNKKEGIYVDIVSGEPLFSSKDKYDSGTGWPSFSKVLDEKYIVTKEDKKLFTTRIEVRSKFADSHLGHVFDDGPSPTYKRYCMNSASMRFIPRESLKSEGYEQYEKLFQEKNQKHLAVFAGGCFWCMQAPYDKLKGKGVIATTVGYSGGNVENPTYEQVSSGLSGHIEAIQIEYDPSLISYLELLKIFWTNVDPFDSKGQFCDKGSQYTAGIFYQSEEQKKEIANSIQWAKGKTKIKSEFQYFSRELEKFYPAEEYHQDYYLKNPIRYKYYRFNCGRDKRLKEVWQVEY